MGVEAAKEFLGFNGIEHPIFMTYEEAEESYEGGNRSHALRLWHAVERGPVQGTGTGLYSQGHVFVNVERTAWPVQTPSMRSWSWPGWKTDRTAIGVVAHEIGHYVTDVVSEGRTAEEKAVSREAWTRIIRGKKVSGYEPVPDEAGAESLRLFILNPDLLRKAIPARYNFLTGLGLKPLPRLLRKGYAAVINNPAYLPAAQRFAAEK